MRTLHVRMAELDSVDWEALRGASTQLCIGDADAGVLSVYVEWNWVRSHEQARTDPRREPALAV